MELTPGAQRAMLAATTWNRGGNGAGKKLGAAEILLGLLAEPECRAALLLAGIGVDLDTAQQRFSELRPHAQPDPQRLESASDEWERCLLAVQDLLIDYPRPLTLATEHLLLGIVAADNEVSRWLEQQGMSRDSLEAEVHRLSGHEPGPLPLDIDLTPEPPARPEVIATHEPVELPRTNKRAPCARSTRRPTGPMKGCASSKTICGSSWTIGI